MRVVLQRVLEASVKINGEETAKIDKGIVALVGINTTDDDKVIDYILEKIVNLRIFEDSEDKMNLSLIDIEGELLIVPNFTIYGDTRKGRRPGFSYGAKPAEASLIFENLKKRGAQMYPKTKFGVFQADMKVSILNDGPVTLLLDSDKIF